ncbi:MAG: tetratricopeptide repeat protein, partial [Solirubrobacteraceae bacterium]
APPADVPTAAATGTAPAATATGRRRVRFKLPLAAAHFAGRMAELEELQRTLGVPERTLVTQSITGLGGVGKSRLAARYVQQYADRYDIVAWIHAEDGGIADLAELAAALGLPTAQLTSAERAAEALRWLGGADERWLLVLDNVAIPERLRDCCPSAGDGRVIITTRDRGMAQFGSALAVAVFDEPTAVEYLIERAGRPDDRAGAVHLARALGCLPLALSHAGAYCASGTSFDDYLEMLDELPAEELFDSHPEASYAQTVASTWQVSIAVAEREAPLARPVLTMAAYLASDAIPRGLFEVLLEGGPSAGGRKKMRDAFNALHRLSLAEVDDTTISVHRLLQKTIRDDLDGNGDQHAARSALAAVAVAFPTDRGLAQTWPECERLLPHAVALADLRPPDESAGLRLVALLNSATSYLLSADPGRRALETATRASACAERILGPEHPEALAARLSLADAYFDAGRLAEAIELGERVLADSNRILGPDHRDTLSIRRIQADYRYEAGHMAEAIVSAERVLADCERILGPEHPETLLTCGMLACFYCPAGRIAEAIELEERVLADHERTLGPDHLHTLFARNNLASSYFDAGRMTEAKERREALLADALRILGPDHVLTVTVRAKVALSYRAAGRSEEAIDLEERVLIDRARILGAEHHHTITARANLAASYREAGRIGEAIELEEQVVAERARVLGDEHPSTVAARGSLADSYRVAGRPEDALAVTSSAPSGARPAGAPESVSGV